LDEDGRLFCMLCGERRSLAYKNMNLPHIRAALAAPDHQDATVRFVYVAGPGPLAERAVHPSQLGTRVPDFRHYASKVFQQPKNELLRLLNPAPAPAPPQSACTATRTIPQFFKAVVP
jgi:hypothetical protein